jgi:hypothetical protein
MSSTNPRPIHSLHREIRSDPDEAEPSYSFESEAFMLTAPELNTEDEFHRRLQLSSSGNNTNSKRTSEGGAAGASFWRSSSAETTQPVFSSAVHSALRTNLEAKKAAHSKSTGLLSAALLDDDGRLDKASSAGQEHGAISTVSGLCKSFSCVTNWLLTDAIPVSVLPTTTTASAFVDSSNNNSNS